MSNIKVQTIETRFIFAIAIAMLMHVYAFHLLIKHTPDIAKTIKAELLNVPTTVHIQIKKPVKKQPIIPKEPVVEMIDPDPVVEVKPQKTIQPEAIKKAPPPPKEMPEVVVPETIVAPPAPVVAEIPVVTFQKLTGKRIKPIYPKRAERLNQQGVVWYKVLVAPSGKVLEVKLDKPSKWLLLNNNEDAVRKIQQWPFEKQSGKIWVSIPIEYKMQ